MADSTPRSSPRKASSPAMPRPDFPLNIHKGTGYWWKKIKGRVCYFGSVATDLAKTRHLVALGKETMRVRSVFKFAYDEGLIPTAVANPLLQPRHIPRKWTHGIYFY